MPFQFAVYYLFDKSLKVESTSILLDSFKDLVIKKNLFLLGKDIWNESKGVHVKKKMLDTNEVEAKKARLAKQTKIREIARDQILQKLKNSLSQSRALDTQDQQTSSEDEVPQCLQNVKQAKTKKAGRPLAFTSNHHISSDEATNIASPLHPDHHTSSDDATNIGSPEMFQANDSDEECGLTSTKRKAS